MATLFKIIAYIFVYPPMFCYGFFCGIFDIEVNHPQAEDLWACHEQSSL